MNSSRCPLSAFLFVLSVEIMTSRLRNYKDIKGFQIKIDEKTHNVILSQIMCSASFLNYDLFKVNIVASPNCNCRSPREDAEHFFFFCKIYSLLRNDVLQSLSWVPFNIDLNLNLITKGSDNLILDEDIHVFRNAYKFIRVQLISNCFKRNHVNTASIHIFFFFFF